MSEKPEKPVYRAAAETAHEELRQIAERLSHLRERQQQICVAVEALKQLLGAAQDAATPANRQALATPVYTMAGRPPQQVVEKLQALA